MSDGSEDEDKQFEPTQKKLDDARKKGEIARSTDLNTAASYFGIVLVSLALGSGTMLGFGELLAALIANSDKISEVFFSDSAQPVFGGIIHESVINAGPWFLIPGLVVLLTILAQRSFIIAPTKLVPKLSRLSLLANAKNKFGRSGLFEFSKSFFKLLIYSILLAIFLNARLEQILGTVHLPPALVTSVLLRLVVDFLSIVLIIALSIGFVDFAWQKAEHTRKNMMSRKEVTDEAKESEGDPHMKQQRRQKGYEIAMNQMLADVPKADVIIVNPEHYAVALQWDRAAGRAPTCVAKGVDEIAARIREIAAESGIPIHRDPPTARTLFATVEVGQEIQPEQYKPVAAAIRFAEMMRKKVRLGGR